MALKRSGSKVTSPAADTTNNTHINTQEQVHGNQNQQNNHASTVIEAVKKPTTDKKPIIIGILAAACFALPIATYFAVKPETVSNETVKAAVEKFGTVQEQQTIGNITANVVKTDNGQALIYSTQDGKNLIMGDVYDLDGKPVFEELLQKMYNTPLAGEGTSADTAPATTGQVLGEYKGEVPEVFTYLESLGGFKEDATKGPADTVYVVYDPRCPYCHELFRKTRGLDLAAKGVTIKWLPTLALGNSKGEGSDAEKLAVKGLHIKDITELENTFGRNPDVPDIQVTKEDRDKLSENLAMLFGSVEELHGPNAPKAVPTAFYLDKSTGKPRLLVGPNEDSALKTIFGDS